MSNYTSIARNSSTLTISAMEILTRHFDAYVLYIVVGTLNIVAGFLVIAVMIQLLRQSDRRIFSDGKFFQHQHMYKFIIWTFVCDLVSTFFYVILASFNLANFVEGRIPTITPRQCYNYIFLQGFASKAASKFLVVLGVDRFAAGIFPEFYYSKLKPRSYQYGMLSKVLIVEIAETLVIFLTKISDARHVPVCSLKMAIKETPWGVAFFILVYTFPVVAYSTGYVIGMLRRNNRPQQSLEVASSEEDLGEKRTGNANWTVALFSVTLERLLCHFGDRFLVTGWTGCNEILRMHFGIFSVLVFSLCVPDFRRTLKARMNCFG